MVDTVHMPALPTARDAMIWTDHNTLPGDHIVYHGTSLPQVVDTNTQSSTYGKRVNIVIRGRKFTNENPINKPHAETFSPPGVNDSIPIVELQAAQDPRTGTWHGGEIQGFKVRGGNQEHESSSRLAIQGQTGIAVDPKRLHADLCKATLCTVSEVYHDGYSGPGGTLACYFEWVCRMAQILHHDGNFMKMGKVTNCHRAYAAELYGATYHVIHGIEISDMEFLDNPGYWDYPVAAGNGYDFGLRYLRNTGDQWAWAYTWNFNGFISSSVEIGNSTFTRKSAGSAVDLRNVQGGTVHDNNMPCDDDAFAKLHNCKYVDVVRNVGGPNTTKQFEVW